MSKSGFFSATQQMDIKLLERLLKETNTITDRYGARVVYYVPANQKNLDVCRYVFQRNGIPMEKYESALYPQPVLKITFTTITQLPAMARNFLFRVNVNPDALNNHFESVLREMQQKQK
ncbi:MAG: hypothetical protein E7006_00710 [Alphaproteobacteria bacterium]|nr:hypothetical protein [Alphaproteobacteria bacterium]